MSTLPVTGVPAASTVRGSTPTFAGRAKADARGVATPVSGRPVVGVAVVLFILLVQATNQYLSGHETSRVLGHLCFLGLEVPVVLIVLSKTYAALKQRQVGATTAVGITVLVAGALGSGFGVLLSLVNQHYPLAMLRPVSNFTFARGALYGFSQAQFHMGIWALAFAYPLAIDETRRKDLEAEQLRSAAELARLRAHLEPHFLLNTLNTIAGLVTEEPREARRLIGCLGDLLREALHDDDELQTLRAQIEWLKRYAAILQARHAGALTFEWDIADATGSVLLPRLLLQPLVENAVTHGALRRSGGGEVKIRTHWTESGALECLIDDNGPDGIAETVRPGAFGLRAIVRRAELKYPGSSVTLEAMVEDGTTTGTRARVLIPGKALDAAAQASS